MKNIPTFDQFLNESLNEANTPKIDWKKTDWSRKDMDKFELTPEQIMKLKSGDPIGCFSHESGKYLPVKGKVWYVTNYGDDVTVAVKYEDGNADSFNKRGGFHRFIY